MHGDEQRYQRIFERVTAAILEVDFSEVMSALDELAARDTGDARAYLSRNPAAVHDLTAKIVITEANDSAVALCRAASRDELLGPLDRLILSTPVLEQAVLALAGGKSRFEAEALVQGRHGAAVRVWLSMALPGHPDEGGILCVTDMTRAEDALAACRQELERSRHELEQFAYVASHDLNEPLRIVASFAQLLAKRYGGQLDERADRYIGHVVDGAKRMQGLLAGLLELSRVTTRGKPPRPTSCEDILDQVLATMDRKIRTSGAQVTHDELPAVMADPAQLAQVFHHLISNGIVFGGQEPPRIHLSAEHHDEGDGAWILSFEDNGMGIEGEFFDDIFAAFRRLHPRDQYPGIGMGLAIVKKIAERHGGRVWVESEVGVGSTFHVTFPAPTQPGEPEQ